MLVMNLNSILSLIIGLRDEKNDKCQTHYQ